MLTKIIHYLEILTSFNTLTDEERDYLMKQLNQAKQMKKDKKQVKDINEFWQLVKH